MQLPTLRINLSSARSAVGNSFPSAADVDFELTKSTTAFLDTDGMGYSQDNFKTTCQCGFLITMDNLGMYKFVKNIIERNPPASYLAYVFYPIPNPAVY